MLLILCASSFWSYNCFSSTTTLAPNFVQAGTLILRCSAGLRLEPKAMLVLVIHSHVRGYALCTVQYVPLHGLQHAHSQGFVHSTIRTTPWATTRTLSRLCARSTIRTTPWAATHTTPWALCTQYNTYHSMGYAHAPGGSNVVVGNTSEWEKRQGDMVTGQAKRWVPLGAPCLNHYLKPRACASTQDRAATAGSAQYQ